jgi:tRNA threonylcarbamoyladenosine biosynthesis protein TsaE
VKYPYSLKIFTEAETRNIALEFSKDLQKGDLVILNGELGTGKTFFVKEIGKIFGVNTVSSPTFALVNEYSGKFKIYHLDFYRIEKYEEIFDIGFNDYINDNEAIMFIEWGELYSEILPHKRFEIEIKLNEDFSRSFRISRYD